MVSVSRLVAVTIGLTLGLALLVVPGSGWGAGGRVPTQPMPTGPVYRGIPGALPPAFSYAYNALSPGWPVSPRSVQHPIRGAFIDPRGRDDNGLSGYHFGVDINVDDAQPDPGAPPGLSHRVYALDAGYTNEAANMQSRRCLDRRLEVGHFSYWHVSPIVAANRRVSAGQQIGWTCRGVWHVHLSEWQLFRGKRVWVDPLHKGGALVPYTDTAPPVVSRLVFVTPSARPWQPTKSLAEPDSATVLPPTGLHGLVELRADVADPQSFQGFLSRNPAWPTVWTPYKLSVEIRDRRTGRRVMSRTSFEADQMPQTPYLVHYAPGTVEDDNMAECVGPPQLPKCDGITRLRPFSRFREEFWNTRAVANGTYEVTVRAYDIAGNTGSRSITVTVKN
ncbi:MAG TPA: hypothetical protein VIL79_01635 [Thermoleophilia bacterium]